MASNPARDLLDKARALTISIRRTTRRIDTLRDMATNSAVGGFRERSGTVTSNGKVEQCVIGIVDAERDMQADAAELDSLLPAVRAMIDALDCPEHRQVLRLRYIDGMSWRDVATACCYSQSYVYKLHGRALLAAAATMRGGDQVG